MILTKEYNIFQNSFIINITVFRIIFILMIILLSFSPSLWAKNNLDKAVKKEIISYDNMINKEIYTHSKESIATVLNKKSINDATKKALLQPYFEQFSKLSIYCLPETQSDYKNIIDLYPVYSAQPAWAALFRDGQYQLFYSKNCIRIFIAGESPEKEYLQHYSLLRHPINQILAMDNLKITKLEVYTFNNNYQELQIEVNKTPYIIKTSNLEKDKKDNYYLRSNKSPLDLEGLENIFKLPMIPQAIETTKDNKLFIYAHMNKQFETFAKSPISLSDFAVIYRAIFHYGYNSPYISIDQANDYRKAYVNFGGYLEHTRVGEVVLEADKLFKTITSGIDLESNEFITDEISQEITDFMTEDQYTFLDNLDSQKLSSRYWFYPDSVLTITDGDMGIVKKCQFFADVERMDNAIHKTNHSKQSIDHLNANYTIYKEKFPVLRELDNVGRLMALVNWLKYSKVDERIDLDELLSVELPAYHTPLEHNKFIILSNITYPKDQPLTPEYVKQNVKHFYLTDLIPDNLKIDSEQDIFDFSRDYNSKLGHNITLPYKFYSLYKEQSDVSIMIDSLKNKIYQLKAEVESMQNQKNYSRFRYEKLIDEQNTFITLYNKHVKRANALVNQINALDLSTSFIVSINGGIDLSPNKFKIKVSTNDPEIKRLKTMKFNPKDNVSVNKSWLKNVYKD